MPREGGHQTTGISTHGDAFFFVGFFTGMFFFVGFSWDSLDFVLGKSAGNIRFNSFECGGLRSEMGRWDLTQRNWDESMAAVCLRFSGFS